MKIKPKYMMATTAFHQLGDISNPTPDICVVTEENDDHYIGHWVFGLGFFGVKLPKETTRELNDAELAEYDGQGLAVCSMLTGNVSYECGKINLKKGK